MSKPDSTLADRWFSLTGEWQSVETRLKALAAVPEPDAVEMSRLQARLAELKAEMSDCLAAGEARRPDTKGRPLVAGMLRRDRRSKDRH